MNHGHGSSAPRGKGAGKARVALARRLAGLLWRLWKDETVFAPQAA